MQPSSSIHKMIAIFILWILAIPSAHAFELISSALTNNQAIPVQYTCDGKNITPPLQWRDVPPMTRSYALIMNDPDAPAGVWDHWLLFNIPGDLMQLNEDMKPLPYGSQVGSNSWQRSVYNGPCPPDKLHHYQFTLYALDTRLNLPDGANRFALMNEMQGHILGQTTLTGTYQRRR